MFDASSFLATLSQSSAAIVAIIGGFLVSRLVSLSSERETIKRQLKAARGRLELLEIEYGPVHKYRLDNSVSTMEGWLMEKLIDERVVSKDRPTEELLDSIPRGSSLEEMLPYAERLRERVDLAFETIKALLDDDDTDEVEFEDVRSRGLKYDERDEDLYERVFSELRRSLPEEQFSYRDFRSRISNHVSGWSFKPAATHDIEMRRLDESIAEESRLGAQLKTAEHEVKRLQHDLDIFAQPVGVMPAVAILALFSTLGIVVPVCYMAYAPRLDMLTVGFLLVCFVCGLCAVLLYIVWYLRCILRSE